MGERVEKRRGRRDERGEPERRCYQDPHAHVSRVRLARRAAVRPSAVFVFPYGPVVWPPGFGTAGHGKAPPGKNCAAAGESLSSLGDCA